MDQKPIAPDGTTSNGMTSDEAAQDSPASARTTLTRTTGQGMVAGVCAGLADYFDVDAVLVRAVFVAGAFMSGFSVVLYLVLWVALDDVDDQQADGPLGATPPTGPNQVVYPADTDTR